MIHGTHKEATGERQTMRVKRICAGEYEIGRYSISRSEYNRTEWIISATIEDGEFYRETVDSFAEAKEIAQSNIEGDRR